MCLLDLPSDNQNVCSGKTLIPNFSTVSDHYNFWCMEDKQGAEHPTVMVFTCL